MTLTPVPLRQRSSSLSTLRAPQPEVPSDYVIGADDTLHISVWKETE